MPRLFLPSQEKEAVHSTSPSLHEENTTPDTTTPHCVLLSKVTVRWTTEGNLTHYDGFAFSCFTQPEMVLLRRIEKNQTPHDLGEFRKVFGFDFKKATYEKKVLNHFTSVVYEEDLHEFIYAKPEEVPSKKLKKDKDMTSDPFSMDDLDDTDDYFIEPKPPPLSLPSYMSTQVIAKVKVYHGHLKQSIVSCKHLLWDCQHDSIFGRDLRQKLHAAIKTIHYEPVMNILSSISQEQKQYTTSDMWKARHACVTKYRTEVLGVSTALREYLSMLTDFVTYIGGSGHAYEVPTIERLEGILNMGRHLIKEHRACLRYLGQIFKNVDHIVRQPRQSCEIHWKNRLDKLGDFPQEITRAIDRFGIEMGKFQVARACLQSWFIRKYMAYAKTLHKYLQHMPDDMPIFKYAKNLQFVSNNNHTLKIIGTDPEQNDEIRRAFRDWAQKARKCYTKHVISRQILGLKQIPPIFELHYFHGGKNRIYQSILNYDFYHIDWPDEFPDILNSLGSALIDHSDSSSNGDGSMFNESEESPTKKRLNREFEIWCQDPEKLSHLFFHPEEESKNVLLHLDHVQDNPNLTTKLKSIVVKLISQSVEVSDFLPDICKRVCDLCRDSLQMWKNDV